MGIIERLNKKDWSPKSGQLNKQELKKLISKDKKNVLFCGHKWVYWTYGNAPRLHRVCEKCYKKQKNRDVINKFIRWIKE